MAGKPKRRTEKQAAQQRVAEKLDALYAELPSLNCKGKCWEVCTKIIMAPEERNRIRREAGMEIPPPAKMARDGCRTCPALKDRRCTVYEVRPTVCRLWGIDETMRCEYGCKPQGGWLTRTQAVRFSIRTYLIAGWPQEVPRLSPKEAAELLRRGELGDVVINQREEHRDRPILEEDRAGGLPLLRRLRRSK